MTNHATGGIEARPARRSSQVALRLRSLLAAVLLAAALPAFANPQGLSVAHGQVTATANGPQLTLTASHNAVLDWQSFNIAAGETTRFLQPSSASVVWNQIHDQNPSQIWGNLQANGTVVLMNQNGFYFGPNSKVEVGGFIAASAAVLPPAAVGGGFWSYQGPPPAAKIINYGEIKAHSGGSVFLIAEGVENHGLISAPDGQVGLFAGKHVLLSERPDGRGLSASVDLPEGSVNNSGQVVADAGSIALHAQVVNQNGLLQANSVQSRRGVIELVAGDSVNLGPGSVLRANGEADTASPGGQITVKSAQTFADDAASRIEIRGGGLGGAGGAVEISAPSMAAINSQIDGTAAHGDLGGQLLIDPTTINIGNTGTGSVPSSGTVSSGSSPATLSLSVNSPSLHNLSKIDLQATGNINVLANTLWDLAGSTGVSGPGCSLTLEAGGNISLQSGSGLLGGAGWSISLLAGRDFTSPSTIRNGTGTITLSGNNQLQTQDGSLTLRAGNNLTFASGSLTTGTGVAGSQIVCEAGGNLTFQSGAGIDAGPGFAVSLLAGRDFTTPGSFRNQGILRLSSGSHLAATDGTITLKAGLGVTLGAAPLTTGSIDVSAGLGGSSGGINLGDSSGIDWHLSTPAAGVALAPQLKLSALNDIAFLNNSVITVDAGWSLVQLSALNGGIFLDGSSGSSGSSSASRGAIQTYDASISLSAHKNIELAGGYIRTVGNANISLHSDIGDVDAGLKGDTYDFVSYSRSASGYVISAAGLGGIGTAAGGNVTVTAGGNIYALDGGQIGAFGPRPGNVTLQAGGQIKGKFMLANGVGTVTAGTSAAPNDIGDANNGASFGLVSGDWSIHASRDLYLNEIYNPNGSLNALADPVTHVQFKFDYAPDARVDLVAGNAVLLEGDHLQQTAASAQAIYAPILTIDAGSQPSSSPLPAGSVTLRNNVILYPSKLGSLTITTHGTPAANSAVGSLRSEGWLPDGDAATPGSPGTFCELILSDSGSLDYRTFATAHAATPLHLGNTGAGIHLDIAGNLQNLFLRSPESANIHVHGNALNFAYEGQNLSANDVTYLTVDGDFISRSVITQVPISGTPNLSIFTDPLISRHTDLGGLLSYDPATHLLSFQGFMTWLAKGKPDYRDILLQPDVYIIDPRTGKRLTDAAGNPLIGSAVFSSDTAAILNLFNATQDVPPQSDAQAGVQVGGPGRLVLTARNLDLGTSAGVRSIGPLLNHNLGIGFFPGASLQLNLAGNLRMTSSQIASFNGGDISITSGGDIDVGGGQSFGGDSAPKGIYTGNGGNLSLHAAGDIDIDGSRVATYNGGNISVISDTGNVDAGAGAKGYFFVTTWQLDAGGVPRQSDSKFFGGGIMATTSPFQPDSSTRVGDIYVQATLGSILANSGGILQIPFNHADQSSAQVTLNAGGSILANQTGILGRNVSLKAGGDITGIIVAAQNVAIDAQHNVAVTALAGGSASVSAGSSISGMVVGAGNVSVAGSEITASVISTGGSASTSGNASAATVGAFTSVAAAAATKTADAADKTVASQTLALADDDDTRKRASAKGPALMRRVGRVTVLLPPN